MFNAVKYWFNYAQLWVTYTRLFIEPTSQAPKSVPW
jgi:hypothetical protein